MPAEVSTQSALRESCWGTSAAVAGDCFLQWKQHQRRRERRIIAKFEEY